MSGIVRNCFSDAIMNVFRHVDASFRAFKTCMSLHLEMGNRRYFSQNGRGSASYVGSNRANFFSAKIKNLDTNCSYFKHVDEKEEKPASHRQ
jgi:hypothetical protein